MNSETETKFKNLKNTAYVNFGMSLFIACTMDNKNTWYVGYMQRKGFVMTHVGGFKGDETISGAIENAYNRIMDNAILMDDK